MWRTIYHTFHYFFQDLTRTTTPLGRRGLQNENSWPIMFEPPCICTAKTPITQTPSAKWFYSLFYYLSIGVCVEMCTYEAVVFITFSICTCLCERPACARHLCNFLSNDSSVYWLVQCKTDSVNFTKRRKRI